MDESIKHVAANRKRYVALGVALLVAGIVIAALTFITVFGPILGLLLAMAGGIIIWRSGQEGAPPPDASGERKPWESVRGTVTTPHGRAPKTRPTPHRYNAGNGSRTSSNA